MLCKSVVLITGMSAAVSCYLTTDSADIIQDADAKLCHHAGAVKSVTKHGKTVSKQADYRKHCPELCQTSLLHP